MSDSLPENSFSGVLKVLKLTSGEEIIGMVSEPTPDQLTIKLPARLENNITKDPKGNLVEYVKLTNYLANIKGFEISLPRTALVYMAQPAIDLEKMYEVYFITMQTDPKSIISSGPESEPLGYEAGLQLLNDLFNNEDFVEFVNDLIENFEGAEIIIDDEDEFEVLEGEETVIEDSGIEEPIQPPKKKRKRKVKPEANSLPYNPELPPENPESWSDNPSDYL